MREQIGEWFRITDDSMFKDNNGVFPFYSYLIGRKTNIPGNMKQVDYNVETGECFATNQDGQVFSIPFSNER